MLCTVIRMSSLQLPQQDTHTHTHTHTHTDLLSLPGLLIDVMVFILYKLYILSLYTNPTSEPAHHTHTHTHTQTHLPITFCIFIFSKNYNLVCLLTHFPRGGRRLLLCKGDLRFYYPCKCKTFTHTHTHTHTHKSRDKHTHHMHTHRKTAEREENCVREERNSSRHTHI